MADRVAALTRVLVFGWLTDLSGAIGSSLEGHGVTVQHAHPPCLCGPMSGPVPTAGPGGAEIESVITIFDGHSVQTLLGRRQDWASRRRLRACANEACELTTTAALTAGARRVLLIGDARRLPPRRRPSAERWTRNLAHRIGYECSVNGMPDHAASYAVVDTDGDVRGVADAVVAWHAGHPHGADLTSASSAPHPNPPS
ncbi:hypothetical protein [Mycolicibacterium sp. HK-90]|uniref:hypothetical protein n=1 Tax=Mycolicibacterium sp. HK-90 TaxID=3056937 RepID=UPI002657BDDE|nr:hypothetical protein [Mycolicibacterium sp. HK-90]WKG04480.1 hypothetical protein QU592_05045 [Mycolicibacterium sp. HK-90]